MRFGVIGLGKSGQAALRLLKILGTPSSAIATFDDKDPSAQFKDSQKLLEEFRPDVLVVSPGVPLSSPWIQNAKSKGIKITSELSLALEHLLEEKIIAITGSVGKSTTSALIAEGALAVDPHAFLGGNFGTPLATYVADCLESSRHRAQYLILELSSFQLENCGELRPEVSVITFLSANHLERYNSKEDYYKTKLDLALRARASLVLNTHGGDLKTEFLNLQKREKISAQILWSDDQIFETALVGTHNQQNLSVAASVAKSLKWGAESLERMQRFGGLSHRLERFAAETPHLWINDSKATSMDSVISAIQSVLAEEKQFSFKTLWVLLGGRDKKLPWTQLKDFSNQKNIEFCFFGEFGEEAKKQSGLSGRSWKSLSDLCESLPWLLGAKDSILLSPGGTSLDEFKGFEARGDFFKHSIEDFYKLEKLIPNLETFTSDTRGVLNEKSAFVALKGDKVDGHDFVSELLKNQVGAIVVEEAKRSSLPQDPRLCFVNSTHKAHRWLAGMFRRKYAKSLKVFGIGGSSGKTSTKEFLFSLLSQKSKGFKTLASQNGEKGIPKTWEQISPDQNFAVIEIGIDAPLEMIKHSVLVQPDFAVLTSIGEEHLNLLKSIDRVFEEEMILFRETWRTGGHCFAPQTDTYLSKLKNEHFTLVPINENNGLEHLPNQYARQNALLAKAMVLHSGFLKEYEWPTLSQKLELPEGRGRTLKLSENFIVIADHYNSNPSSLSAALREGKAMAQKLGLPFWVLLGDMLDLGSETEAFHKSLEQEVTSLCDRVLSVGPEWKKVASKNWACFMDSAQVQTEDLQKFFGTSKEVVLLVKGSRGMKMERLLDQLTASSHFKST